MIEGGVADGAEQHGARARTGVTRVVGEDGEARAQRRAPDLPLAQIVGHAEGALHRMEHLDGAGHDLGADAVAGEERDRAGLSHGWD